jgi:hypothetical protein
MSINCKYANTVDDTMRTLLGTTNENTNITNSIQSISGKGGLTSVENNGVDISDKVTMTLVPVFKGDEGGLSLAEQKGSSTVIKLGLTQKFN